MSNNLKKKIINHFKYLISNIKYIVSPFYIKNLTLDCRLIISFLWSDIKFQFLLKRKYSSKFKKHKEFIKQKIITNDWFSQNIIHLEYFLSKEKLKNKGLDVLEIGSYQGNSTLYFLKNININKITCIDTFKGSDEHDKTKFDNIYSDFCQNIHEYKSQIIIKKSDSKSFFNKNNKSLYDLIYIDGSHNYEDVLIDAFGSFKLLKKNGYMIFDDFLWKYYKSKNKNPINAIKLLLRKNNSLKIFFTSYQIILRKND